MELDSIPPEARERIGQIGTADLVVGLLANQPGDAGILARVREGLDSLATAPKTVIIHSDGASGPAWSEAGGTADGQSVFALSWPLFRVDPVSPAQSISDAYHSIFLAGGQLGARACCVVASSLDTVTPRWISGLVQPVLDLDYDLVAPCYSHHALEGLLNSGVVSPLIRSLYGRKIRNPLGPDFGLSRRLIERAAAGAIASNRGRSLISFAIGAIRDGFRVCQTHVGARHYPPTDWVNLSSLLAQILGPIFLEMEADAAAWQRVRGSQTVPGSCGPSSTIVADGPDEAAPNLEARRLVDSFQLGVRSLMEIWGLILPPATLFELQKLSRLPAERFRMPDELWVRIVYDFALGHRLRPISRDHLLRAMTPLYLGWVASHALELENVAPDTVERRQEQLAACFESGKPYLVSRWRWPDRFNP